VGKLTSTQPEFVNWREKDTLGGVVEGLTTRAESAWRPVGVGEVEKTQPITGLRTSLLNAGSSLNRG